MKLGLSVETENWRTVFGSALSKNYKIKLKRMTDYINDKNEILARSIQDLEDVRVAMKCLGELRDDFIFLDAELIMIEETYTLMGKFRVPVLKEDQNIVDSLRYSFTKMQRKVNLILTGTTIIPRNNCLNIPIKFKF